MKLTENQFKKLKKLDKALIDTEGREILNPVPARFATHMNRPTSTVELMKRVVREELSRAAQLQGEETFEDADDFDVPDDFDVETLTQYEMTDLQEEMLYKSPEQIAQEVIDESQDKPIDQSGSDALQDNPAQDAPGADK